MAVRISRTRGGPLFFVRLLFLRLDQAKNKVPFLLGHFGDTKSSLLQGLQALKSTSGLRVTLQLLKADNFGKLAAKLDVHQRPLGILAVCLRVVVRVLGVKRGFWNNRERSMSIRTTVRG